MKIQIREFVSKSSFRTSDLKEYSWFKKSKTRAEIKIDYEICFLPSVQLLDRKLHITVTMSVYCFNSTWERK